jgi:predicted ATPase
LLTVLDECGNRGQAQFLVATHSPLLLALPGAQIVHFSDAGVGEMTYQETEHYRIYRDFLIDPEAFLRGRRREAAPPEVSRDASGRRLPDLGNGH